MEDKCASYCSSLDAISEESEMIAHLQSVFWSSSYFDPNLCSSNNSISLSSSSSISVINESNDTSYDHHEDTLVAANEINIGTKRKIQMEEQKEHDKQVCTTLSAPRKNGNKPRAAMDSQSHYAKKRRQRINERLKVLQQLIPNGTKVDISTMLEEAVRYVKFLHLQIQVLSSDETWMYAPLAYNGVDVSLPHLDSLAQE